MPLTLGFDTSLGHISAAIVRDGQVLAHIHETMAKGQAEHLMPMMDGMLGDTKCSWADLEKIGVGIGPGNFTGIRIAVSAAKGLAFARSLPLVGVSMLEALAHASDGSVRAVIPAPRDSVYFQDFENGAPLGPAAYISLDQLPKPSTNKILGPAAAAAQKDEQIAVAANTPGVAIALIAEARKSDSPPAPLYLRAADAAPSRIAAPVILDQ